jgi:hypothetical protein
MSHGRTVRNIALIVASALSLAGSLAALDGPPEDLLKKIAATATEGAKARDQYTYRQVLSVQDFDQGNIVEGEYKEVHDIIFSPNGGRFERAVSHTLNTLTKINLTQQDYQDIRNIQPFFLTRDNAWLYGATYKGPETVDGIPCFVADIKPKQILANVRYFQGTLWVRQSDFGVVKSQGQAVPQIETLKEQNLFPHFTTNWKEIDGKWMFPVETYADDTLFFRDWPQRIRISIRYENYRKFGAESAITYGDEPTSGNPGVASPPANAAPSVPPPNQH